MILNTLLKRTERCALLHAALLVISPYLRRPSRGAPAPRPPRGSGPATLQYGLKSSPAQLAELPLGVWRMLLKHKKNRY